jgi:hypothetical protein
VPYAPLPGRAGLVARAAPVVLAVRDAPAALAVRVAPDVLAALAARVGLAVQDGPVALVVRLVSDVLAAPVAPVGLAPPDVQVALAVRASGRLAAVSGAAPLGISAAGGRPEISSSAVRRAARFLSSDRPPAEAVLAVEHAVADGEEAEDGGDGGKGARTDPVRADSWNRLPAFCFIA